jgi:hypothetical protein
MSKTFTIKAIQVSAEDAEKVRDFKFKFIDYTNSMGVYYVANGFVSFCLNRMLATFNQPEDLVFETGDCEARQCDLETFREQGAVFLNILKKKLSDESVFEHVQEVFARTIDTLEALTAEARLAREEAAKTEQV